MRVVVLLLVACSNPSRAPDPVPVPKTTPRDAAVELPTAIAAGRSHTCVLERGDVSCWGKNDQGQLGDGTKASSAKPVRVVGLPPAIAITLGDDHSCAIVQDGNVYCWGRGGEGQLAQTPPVDSAKPIAIGLVAKDLAAGHQHTCAVLDDGGVACWGHESYGELGGADASKRVPNIRDATQVRIGSSTTCVLRRGGVVTCWGGHWLSGLFENEQKQQKPIDIPALAGVTELAVGAYQACGVRDGVVICRGESRVSGDPAAKCCSPVTTTLALPDVRALVAGFEHGCALRNDGTVACWGADAPASVAGLADIRHIAAGFEHTCTIDARKVIQCWGDDDFGQLGRGLSSRMSTPQRVPHLDDVRALAIGYVHNCALRANGAVACWPGRTDPRPYDVKEFGTATAIASGIYETCVHDAKRSELRCLQRNSEGFPAGKVTAPRFDAMSVGGAGICVRTVDKKLACVREVMDAHSIPGPLEARKLAVLPGVSNVRVFASGGADICAATATEVLRTSVEAKKPSVMKNVAAADVVMFADTCALMRDGTITCFTSGEGKPVAGIDDATQLTVGDSHACALRKDGTVWCWGTDECGELGDGDQIFEKRETPNRVSGLANVLEVQAGYCRTCARTKDGVWCWGSNERGRLGSTFPRSDVPVTVTR